MTLRAPDSPTRHTAMGTVRQPTTRSTERRCRRPGFEILSGAS